MPDDTLQTAVSVFKHTIRLTARQWVHVTEAHDYMSGNMDIVLETLAEPDLVVTGSHGARVALRHYARKNITQKTAVVVYRDEPGGFVITAFLTSRPERIATGGQTVWTRSRQS